MANYLTFSSPSSFTLGVYNNYKYWDGTLEYSTDGSTWTTWAGTSAISSASDGTKHNLYLRGTGNTKITSSATNSHWVLTGSEISCTGNIETLLDYATVANGEHPAMASYCFNVLFYDCTSLITAPALPATTLANECYRYMFYNCTNLTTAPALPATTLANECYSRMFYNCTSLTTIPELPATTLATSCYSYMFHNCTQIKLSTTQTGDYQTAYRIPTSGTGTTATDALSSMFTSTGGTFKSTPTINTTYYTSNEVIPATEPEPEPEEPKIIFNITENTEFTLATKGKYCDKDIAVNVAVPVPEVTTEEKTVTPTKSTQTVTPTNANYLSKVTVNPIPSNYIVPSGTKSITNNGTHDVTSYASVSVNVADIPAVVGTKEITENGVYDAIDDGLEGYSSVTVNVPTYITVSSEDELPTDAVDGTIAIVEASGEESVSITVKTAEFVTSYYSSIHIKLGERPTSSDDFDVFVGGGNVLTPQTFTTKPVAYIWGGGTYYTINGGSPNLVDETDNNYANAVEVSLSNNDVITLYSSMAD